MSKTIFFLPLFFALISCGNFVFGQTLSRTVVSSAGGTATVNNVILAYNIGEPVADLLINTTARTVFTVGFIQPDNSTTTTPTALVNQQLVIYPNPVTGGTARLDFRDIPDGSYVVDIVDAVGHVLYTRTIAYSKNNNINLDLNVSGFKGGTYYVRVRNDKASGQVKLIKL